MDEGRSAAWPQFVPDPSSCEDLSLGEEEAVWVEPKPGASESELDAYARRQAEFDPDLWLVEIEDREGRSFLTEKIEKF